MSFQRVFLLFIWLVSQVTGMKNAQRDSTCTDGDYKTPEGLEYKLVCNQAAADGNVLKYKSFDNVTECMDYCSWANSPCYGVTYNTITGNCSYLDSQVTGKTNSSTIIHSTFVPQNQFSPDDGACPFVNQSTVTISDADFLISCGLDFNSHDYNERRGAYAYHTDTMESCMGICAALHPICKAISWNPDMKAGYSNCYPKYENTTAGPFYRPYTYISHTAELVLNNLKLACLETPFHVASTNKSFDIHCSGISSGGNDTALHTDNLESCIDACSSNSSCLAVDWNPFMDQGYQNCYLKSSNGTITDSMSFHTASLTNNSINTTINVSPTSTAINNGTKSSNSLPWVAGPIIGGVVVLVLVGSAAYLIQRRKKASISNASCKPDGSEKLAFRSELPASAESENPNELHANRDMTQEVVPLAPARYELAETRFSELDGDSSIETQHHTSHP